MRSLLFLISLQIKCSFLCNRSALIFGFLFFWGFFDVVKDEYVWGETEKKEKRIRLDKNKILTHSSDFTRLQACREHFIIRTTLVSNN